MPEILYTSNGKLKLATTEGCARYRDLTADGLTHDQADRIVYHPANRGLYWIIDRGGESC